MKALRGPSGVPIGVHREGPGKAKEGRVCVFENERNEEKESEDHLKNLQAPMGSCWGPCRPRGGLRRALSRSLRGLWGNYWCPLGHLGGPIGALRVLLGIL
jgi:hypothetical protein